VAFYVNIILGLDYDSFSPEGGTLFFQRAEAIVTNAQNARSRAGVLLRIPGIVTGWWRT
jgi:hypothetical protein